MKILKEKMIWFVIMAVAGMALFVVSILQGISNNTITGFASGLTVISIMKLVQFYRISKDSKLLKKFEIQQKEERFIAIAEKSGRFTLLLTIFIEFIAIFVLILINQNDIANIVSAVAGIQTLVYLIIYYYFCKKY